jgi:transcriptional regulator with XRE-family HTH domain
MTLAERLIEVREGVGISARALSIVSDLHPTHISLIERGERLDPTSSVIDSVSVVLNCTTDYLIAGRGPKPEPHSLRNGLKRHCEALLRDPDTKPLRRETAERTLKDLAARFPGALGHTCNDFTRAAAPRADDDEDDEPSGPVVVTEGFSQVVGG